MNPLPTLKDNSTIKNDCPHDSREYETIKKNLADIKLSNILAKNSGLLVFPDSPGANVMEQCIFKSSFSDSGGREINTTNLMGVIILQDKEKDEGDLKISIGSRFDVDSNGEVNHDQPFIIHMLSKAFDIAVHENFQTGDTSRFMIDVLLVIIFFKYLEMIYQKGLYKSYFNKIYNGFRFKGKLDVNLHLKQDIPFTGKITTRYRELTADNPVMWLIRHTINYVRNRYGAVWKTISINKSVNEVVKIVEYMTPSYNRQKRYELNRGCMTRIRHPFYAEYEKLRKICILILRKEGLNVYDHSDEDVFGILFDGAWIWEKYIATLLKGLGFKHYVKNKISVFKEMSTPNFRPDYYNNTESIVLDAKYKRWDINQWGDLHQIISYMYITKSNVGGIVYPVGSDSNEEIDKKVITGEKGVFLRLPFNVPPSDKDFHFNIRKYERKWVSDVKTKIGMDSAN